MAPVEYRFGEFRLDLAQRKLLRGDEEVALPLKVFQSLDYLIENRDRAVGRDELIDAVWGSANLSDGVLAQAILRARQALGDSGQDQQYIETVRGFGYRWAAPVETLEPPPAAPEKAARGKPIGLALALTILVAMVAAGVLVRQRDREPPLPDEPAAARAEGEIALLLPVTVDADGDHAWVRLGLMDLIASRLQTAGLPMVPSDSVVALVNGLSPERATDDASRLTATTGADLVLAARARATGARWMVSLHSLAGARPPLTAVGEGEDVLTAARDAADHLASALGLTPPDSPGAESEVELLLQKVRAARLAQQTDVARELVATADVDLREHPAVRLQSAWNTYFGSTLDAARAAFESLIDDPAFRGDSELRGYALYGLGTVEITRRDSATAKRVGREALAALRGTDAPAVVGRLHQLLSIATLVDGEFAAAREHLARARQAYESVGDTYGLALLVNLRGGLQTMNDRYAEAALSFERAAETFASYNDVVNEMSTRANMIEVELGLLDPRIPRTREARLEELMAQRTGPAPGRSVHVDLAWVELLTARGELREAERLLASVTRSVAAGSVEDRSRTWALVQGAEQAMRRGNGARAARLAEEAVDVVLPHDEVLLDDYLSRAWLVLFRARLRDGDGAGAATASTIREWAAGRPTRGPKVVAALVEAELAAARGEGPVARAAFERALALAGDGHAPVRVLRVAQSYVPWLLDDGRSEADCARALVVVDRLAPYVDRHYDAALLQLRVYHALGPPSVWRAALARATALAGERRVPAPLRAAPSAALHTAAVDP